jgi:hypothetical protein
MPDINPASGAVVSNVRRVTVIDEPPSSLIRDGT